MKKMISLDIGGTLYNHESIKNSLGKINNNFNLGMSGLAMLQLVRLMQSGRIILINSLMQDGTMLAKILSDINYFYQNNLTAYATYEKEELQSIFENNFYISSYGGRRISKLKFIQDSVINYTIKERIIHPRHIHNITKLITASHKNIKIQDIIFKYNSEVYKNSLYEDCSLDKSHIALIDIKHLDELQCNNLIHNLELLLPVEYQIVRDVDKIEIGKLAGKKLAICEICDILDIDTNNVLHIGDASPDMLEGIDYQIVDGVKSSHKKSVEEVLHKM